MDPLSAGAIVEISWLTVRISLAASGLILVPAVLLGYGLARMRFPGRALVQALIGLPMVLPPVAVGLALLLLLGASGPLAGIGLELAFTFWAAALAAAVVGFPLLTRASEQAFREIDPRLIEVARSLGLGPIAIFLRVALPLAARGVVYGWLLAFTRGLGEFGATALVAGIIPGRTETLALGIWSRVQLGEDRAALLLCGASFAIALAAMWLAEGLLRHRAPKARAS